MDIHASKDHVPEMGEGREVRSIGKVVLDKAASFLGISDEGATGLTPDGSSALDHRPQTGFGTLGMTPEQLAARQPGDPPVR